MRLNLKEKPYETFLILPDCVSRMLAVRLLFAEEDTKPEANIPFSDGALAMVKGISGSGITDVQKELLQSGDRYRLSVRIYQNMTSVVETWYVAYVIPKEYVGKIDLDIEYIE